MNIIRQTITCETNHPKAIFDNDGDDIVMLTNIDESVTIPQLRDELAKIFESHELEMLSKAPLFLTEVFDVNQEGLTQQQVIDQFNRERGLIELTWNQWVESLGAWVHFWSMRNKRYA